MWHLPYKLLDCLELPSLKGDGSDVGNLSDMDDDERLDEDYADRAAASVDCYKGQLFPEKHNCLHSYKKSGFNLVSWENTHLKLI